MTDPFAGQYYFYQYDVRGSVTDILDKNAGLVKGYDYDEFGNTEEKGNESFLNDVTFTGSVSDASSGLQYMNARFYQPSTGRFLSQDSYSGNPYDPWTQHLYSYCGNNPVNMVDPTGHSAGAIGALKGIWGAALAEPTPYGEIIAAIATIFLGGVIIGEAISSSSSASSSSASAKPKAEAAKSTTIPFDTKIKAQNKFIKRSMEKALGKPKEDTMTDAIPKVKKHWDDATVIYRWGNYTNTNLTPRKGLDEGGLSFSTQRPIGKKYVVTTMEAVNSTGVLIAVQDGATHVSVKPINPFQMEEWMDSRGNAESDPHPYTIALKLVTLRGN